MSSKYTVLVFYVTGRKFGKSCASQAEAEAYEREVWKGSYACMIRRTKIVPSREAKNRG